MNDFISRLTFGFIMAQLLPGAILVLSVTFLVICFGESPGTTISSHLDYSINFWFENIKLRVAFFIVSLSAGMSIHGLHWAVLGFLEWVSNGNPIGKTFWHNKKIIVQMIIGPIKLVGEIIWFLWNGNNIREIAIEENIPNIRAEQIESYKILDDFYLHFAQFYAHMAYALSITTVAIFIYIIKVGFSWYRLEIIISCYLLTGFFFIIGRIQLSGLFKAQNDIKNKTVFKWNRSRN